MDHHFSKLSVYVIEDSEIVLRRLVALIESSGLAKVVGASDDATAAVEEILLLMPDVVLVDIHLRVGSGLDVIGKLKAARCAAIQIVLTNHSLPAVRRAATAAGADHFFDKTNEISAAIATINTLARQRSGDL
ncbi:response regulator [Burkholderia sp. M6-3]